MDASPRNYKGLAKELALIFTRFGDKRIIVALNAADTLVSSALPVIDRVAFVPSFH